MAGAFGVCAVGAASILRVAHAFSLFHPVCISGPASAAPFSCGTRFALSPDVSPLRLTRKPTPMSPLKKSVTRRAPGVVMLSFPAPEKLKDQITKLAARQGLTRSCWIRLRLLECIQDQNADRRAKASR
jgi:hypothetical protein